VTGTGRAAALNILNTVRGGVVSERHIKHRGKRPRPTGQDIQLEIHTSGAMANTLLATLPVDDFNRLKPHFVFVTLAQGMSLFEAHDEVTQIYFPLAGMISLLVLLKNGQAIETATVGREGVVGAMAGLGFNKSLVRAVIQLAGTFARIPSAQFRQAASASSSISKMCIEYNETLLTQARVTAACNISHAAEARFCRWLLQSRDRAESDTVPLTQEFLSEMLGLRRTSVTEVAVKMQEAGVISYSRGIIKIADLAKLKAMSCECYETLRNEAHQYANARL
jgi:CRP-like cAMP-binding protein